MENTQEYKMLKESEYFDSDFYLSQNPDVLDAGIDPIYHYLSHGARERRDPHPNFDTAYYLSECAKRGLTPKNPLLHYITEGSGLGVRPFRKAPHPVNGADRRALLSKKQYDPRNTTNGHDHNQNHSSGPTQLKNTINTEPADYVKAVFHNLRVDSRDQTQGEERSPAKLIAFYLPQFHPIPENDKAWGRGFTEWTNVTKAKPLYKDHNQPSLPAELGFYDLRVAQVMKDQMLLAKEFGIFGFCYYFYWFNGRRVLDKPLDIMLKDNTIEMPFCLCWANENWTRRWDGSEDEVIIAQDFEPEYRSKIINDMMPFFNDSRYIRVGDRPLLLIYRPDIIPDLAETVSGWRAAAKEKGLDLYIAACLTFGLQDPMQYGFDGGVEFPPHGTNSPDITDAIEWTEPFEGKAYSYAEMVRNEIAKPEYRFPTFRCAMPGWDNTPRRGPKGHLFYGATPGQFEGWLSTLVIRSKRLHKPESRFVFINAWNEWAEGAHLEPDQKFGRQWLQACSRALRATNIASSAEIDSPFLEDVIVQSQDGSLDPCTCRLLELLIANQERLRSALCMNATLTDFYLKSLDESTFSGARALTPTEELLGPCAVHPTPPFGWIEVEPGPGYITVSGSEPWFISGWICAQNQTSAEGLHCIITFSSKFDGRSFSAVAKYPLDRPDVTNAYPHLPASVSRASGFQATLDMRSIPRGKYVVFAGLYGETEIAYMQSSLNLFVG